MTGQLIAKGPPPPLAMRLHEPSADGRESTSPANFALASDHRIELMPCCEILEVGNREDAYVRCM